MFINMIFYIHQMLLLTCLPKTYNFVKVRSMLMSVSLVCSHLVEGCLNNMLSSITFKCIAVIFYERLDIITKVCS